METKSKTSSLRMLNPKNVITEIYRYGYNFSFMNYLKYLFAVYAIFGVMSYLYGLRIPFIIVILAVCTVCLPFIILTIYRNMYEQKKFMDLTSYMEQILYSFKRKSKILSALEDTLVLFPEGGLHDAIIEAINHIKNGQTTGNIYREAFAIIEKEYGCKRLYATHNFLIKVEEHGGEFDRNLNILITDKSFWMERIYSLQSEKKNIKTKITIGIILSFIIVGITLIMLPKGGYDIAGQMRGFDIRENTISQITTTVVFILNFLIWFFANQKLSGSWINIEKDVPFEDLKKKYDRVMHDGMAKEKKKWRVTAIAFALVAIACHFTLHNTLVTIVMFALAGAMIFQPNRIYKNAKKGISREIDKAFPEWLMSMALLLQTDNVHVALSRTIDNAPEILKEELYLLKERIDERPNDIEPYLKFFDKLDLPDVATAMKMLYSMHEYGADDIGIQIEALVQRNSIMTDKAIRLQTEDYLAGMGFLVLLPMLTGVIKMIIDMLLLIVALLAVGTYAF